MTNSIRKGKRVERELASRLRDLGFPAARRGQQFKGTEDSPDVVGVPLAHLECKARAKIAGIQEWMAKAVSESGDRIPLVFLKADRWEDFIVALTIQDWAKLWHHFLETLNKELHEPAICTELGEESQGRHPGGRG